MNHADLSAALADAQRRRVPIPPLTGTAPGLTVEDAYEVQRIGVAERVAAGARIIGHKVGLTSPAMQRMLGVDQPDFGHLLDTMVVYGTTPVAGYLQPRAEVEIAFVLRATLRGPGVTVADVLAATGHVCAAIEIIDSRIADWRITLPDTVADNASSAGVVLSGRRVPVNGLELAALEGRTLVDGRVAERGPGSAVLGNPAAAVAWLANTLGPLGTSLSAGHVVLPGAFARAVPVTAGTRVTADIDALGDVEVVFT
jgi:2-oxopent-4-enoate hydratase